MISKETEALILRLYHAEKWPIGTIAAQLHLHHEVVERVVSTEGQEKPPTVRRSKIDPFLPFILAGSVTTLTALDFIGFGLPPGSASLGEMLQQGKNNLQAPWLGFTGFLSIAVLLTLLVFAGEAVRDAFDPRKTIPGAA